ncbi:MAG: radical SAM protein [Proteobacteria bacterium]|nr:radical SAM protein [Pseudomonadota bacterium]
MNAIKDKKILSTLPSLVACDSKGNLFDIPEYGMLARQGNEFVLPEKESLIPLPQGSDLHILPGRRPVGINRKTGETLTLTEYMGEEVFAASAFLAPAHTALYLAAYEKKSKMQPLPLFAYCALGFKGENFVVTAFRVDKEERQDCRNFNQDEIIKRGKKLLEQYKGNRLTTHLIENCAFTYLCPAARNWVMGRWEAPIPVSMGCNSQCHGCISKQKMESGIPATQERLTFIPTADEIIAYTVPHLNKAERAVVSFGQGCEGEPLTQAKLIEEAIIAMRAETKRGTINLNTNASLPAAIERLCVAGLDSIRVSMNSAQKTFYDKYFKPQGYSLDNVLESMRIAKGFGLWLSINYFIYPGFTDSEQEVEALTKLLDEIPVDMIQMRNLNMDPDLYYNDMGLGESENKCIGMRQWMKVIKKVRPAIRFAYFNPSLDNSQ